MKVGVGADHGGFEMKQQLTTLLAKEGYQVVDFGDKTYDDNDDYPDFAIPLARAVAGGRSSAAFLYAVAAWAPQSLPIRFRALARRSVTMTSRPARGLKTTTST